MCRKHHGMISHVLTRAMAVAFISACKNIPSDIMFYRAGHIASAAVLLLAEVKHSDHLFLFAACGVPGTLQ